MTSPSKTDSLAADEPMVAPLVNYNVNEAALSLLKARCADLSADTPTGYDNVRLALGEIRGQRGAIEKRRVLLKADALAYGRLVDSEAKRFTAMLVEIEEPLSQKKADADYEKARPAMLRAAADAEAERVREAAIVAAREAEVARLVTERAALDAERVALAEERRQAYEVEAARVAVERAKLEAEITALADQRRRDELAALAQREVIEAERRSVAAEREQAERVEFERQAKIKAEAEAVTKAELDRLAAAEHAAEMAALAPDIEKVRACAAAIRAIEVPKAKSKKVAAVLTAARQGLEQVAMNLDVEAERVAG